MCRIWTYLSQINIAADFAVSRRSNRDCERGIHKLYYAVYIYWRKKTCYYWLRVSSIFLLWLIPANATVWKFDWTRDCSRVSVVSMNRVNRWTRVRNASSFVKLGWWRRAMAFSESIGEDSIVRLAWRVPGVPELRVPSNSTRLFGSHSSLQFRDWHICCS